MNALVRKHVRKEGFIIMAGCSIVQTLALIITCSERFRVEEKLSIMNLKELNVKIFTDESLEKNSVHANPISLV